MSATERFPPRHVILDDSADRVRADESGDASIQARKPDQTQQQQLTLPSTEVATSTQQLNASNSDDVVHTVRFDDLGPLVINKDGTLSRIHNWAQMTDSERERTLRVLGKRNMLRKEAILKEEDTS